MKGSYQQQLVEKLEPIRTAISNEPGDLPFGGIAPEIECAGRKGIFPEANHDPVIQIANMVTRYGEDKPFVRNVFCLDTCSPIINTQLLEFIEERMMLIERKNFVQKVDPDVIIGYNTANFDTPYLLDRAKHLKANEFPFGPDFRT